MEFQIDVKKMKAHKIPKELKTKWAKNGGVENSEYKAWIKKYWSK